MKAHVRECILIVAAVFSISTAARAAGDTLTVVFVNDTYGHLLPSTQYGFYGIARAATAAGGWLRSEPNAIFVHVGDFSIGSLECNLFHGVPELRILDTIGLDVLNLGISEFSNGPQQLAAVLDSSHLSSRIGVVCSNARNVEAVPALAKHLVPATILIRKNLKIGVMGFEYPPPAELNITDPIVLDTAIVSIACHLRDSLRGAGCQIVIVLSRLGLTSDCKLARSISGIDAIIGGWSRLHNDTTVHGIPIIQSGEFYHGVGKVHLLYDGEHTRMIDDTFMMLYNNVDPQPIVSGVLAQLKQQITAAYTPVLGDPFATIGQDNCSYIGYEPHAFDTLDSPLGNLFADAMKAYVPSADFACDLTGDFNEDLYPGPITPADVFHCVPIGTNAVDKLGDRLVRCTLTGSQVVKMFQTTLDYSDPDGTSYSAILQTSGLDYTAMITPDRSLRLASITIGGQPVDTMKTYTVVTVQTFAGYVASLLGVPSSNFTSLPVSTVLVLKNYIAAHSPLCLRATMHNKVVPYTGVHESSSLTVPEIAALPNYPNPTSGPMNFMFALHATSTVHVEMLDAVGRVVQTLVHTNWETGTHTIAWDGRDDRGQALPAGVYTCRLVTPRGIAVRQCVVVH